MREVALMITIPTAPSVDASRRHLPRFAGEDQSGWGAPPFTGDLSAQPTERALRDSLINREGQPWRAP
jgi:hypothetical protein